MINFLQVCSLYIFVMGIVIGEREIVRSTSILALACIFIIISVAGIHGIYVVNFFFVIGLDENLICDSAKTNVYSGLVNMCSEQMN